MNYFELINKCLIELNYKKVDVFTDLIKNDHEKIKNILNVINAEVCSLDNWNFLLRKAELILPKNIGEIQNSITGRIHSVYVDGSKYNFYPNFEKFLMNTQPSNTYTVFNDKLLFPIYNENKCIEVVYYTNQFAQTAEGADKDSMIESIDAPSIPAPFAEPILVYGTCMRLKGNSEYAKFSYWYGMYKEALANMRSKIGAYALETPQINLKRR